MKTTQITEYWISPLDEHGDVQDQFYYDTRKEALDALPSLQSDIYPDITQWQIEKVVSKYASDGDLINRTYTELESVND